MRGRFHRQHQSDALLGATLEISQAFEGSDEFTERADTI